MEGKKKLIVILVVFIAIIGVVLFAFRGCDKFRKDPETETYAAFINASIDLTCEIMQNPALVSDPSSAQDRTYAIYEEWKLPVQDNEAMFAILSKYENDKEVIKIVKENSATCKNGGSPKYYSAK
ncbi:hypothetical protein HY605_03190 [Candidatus Peregrinibacteria bacterium]|nr:hypothetical protein [Candidatus Peregrinibacteria bacterium]